MKPNFAFTLSYKGIGLLHRAFPGWHLVGDVGFDTPDLAAALADLRQKADQLDPAGVFSKLVIPNDQIKYITLPASQASDAEHDSATENQPETRVRAALVGATPYEVEDLAYAWSIVGGQLHIAAVAKETLAEAENFANEHRFHPLCFVAIPEAGSFDGEPFFGETGFSKTVLEAESRVARDTTAIVVIGEAVLPVAERDTVAPLDAEAAQSDAPEPPTETDADLEDGPALSAPPEPAPESPAPVGTFSSIRAKRGDYALQTPHDAARLNGVDRTETPQKTPEPAPEVTPEAATPPTSTLTAPSIPISPSDDLATPAASRRFTPVETAPVSAPDPLEDTRIAPMPSSEEAGPDATDIEAVAEPKGSFFSRRKPSTDQARTTGLPKLLSRKKPTPAAATTHSTFPAPEDEKQRMTVFGARDDDNIGGKPQHLGLILTMVLLLFLAGVAAWATIFLDDGLAGLFSPPKDEPVIALPLPEAGEDQLAAELAAEGDEAALPTPSTMPLSEPDTVPFDAPQTATELALVQPDVQPGDSPVSVLPQPIGPPGGPVVAFDRDQAVADYAATGIWQIAPAQPLMPGPRGLDDLYITSIDRAVLTSDAVALPLASAAESDHLPRTQLSPIAPEVRFAYDERGLVIATAEGALTPDGITVFLGRPQNTPPQRPTRFAEDPTVVAQAVRMAKLRPRGRPGDLIEQNERSTLGGRTLVEMARLRPTARPRIDPAKLAEEADETATAQAVTTSRKPSVRPRNFGRIVARTLQRQQDNPDEAAITTVAAVAPRTVTPSVPSNASVARLATARNAINLRRINLIGVYGKPSSRRALVRLSNGRYKKVKVGDRIDGGRISSIGESELRYIKSGRDIILKMPRG